MASPNISFDHIPSSIRKPGKYFEFNTRLAVRTLPANLQRVLIVAQHVDGKQVPMMPVQVFDDIAVATLCGYGSQAHRMCKAAIKANRYLDVSVLPIASALAGVAAKATYTITGAATAMGVLSISIGSDRLAVSVAALGTPTTVAEALAEAINNEESLPVFSCSSFFI